MGRFRLVAQPLVVALSVGLGILYNGQPVLNANGVAQTPDSCISSSVFPKNRKEKFPTLGMGYSHISAGNIFI